MCWLLKNVGILAFACAIIIFISFRQTAPVAAAPLIQLPWPTGVTHLIDDGYGYGCGTHTDMTASSGDAYNADYFALDFEVTYDQPVAAASAGTVLVAAEVDNYGVKVVLDHGGGFLSVYAHLHFVAAGIQQGASVAQGQTVGYADATGYNPPAAHICISTCNPVCQPSDRSRCQE